MKNLRRGLKKIGQRLGAKNPLSRETSEQTPMPSVQAFEKELDEQKQRAHDNHDRYLKIYTKLQNYKKQIENKTEDVLKYGNEELMRKILPFIDNLERVIEHGHSEQNPNTKALIEGIQLAIQDVKRLSEKYGAVPEDSGGDPDDIESQTETFEMGEKTPRSRTMKKGIRSWMIFGIVRLTMRALRRRGRTALSPSEGPKGVWAKAFLHVTWPWPLRAKVRESHWSILILVDQTFTCIWGSGALSAHSMIFCAIGSWSLAVW
jgi:molecular chaperone GrpE